MPIDYEAEVRYYRRALQHPTIGALGRAYLEERGINEETIEAWELGWAPVGATPTPYKGQNTQVYKKLWGRITIPVREQSGTLVTISGRLVVKADVPKYDMYSSGNSFSARRVLFGLWQNKRDIQDANHAIITEGQMDVITAWQKGVRFVTSSFGAHCSADHIAVLSRYAGVIDIVYDGDKAGKKGLENFKKISTLGDLQVRLRNPFPQGDDLDSWLKTHTGEELNKLLNKDPVDSLKERLKLIGRSRQ